ncbi:uncharacterized protein LOC119778806 [Cyprinodon tularosa]|uniref:uncharacterized protein LOC119778806 n=1 Tax=Cyprinodon tularosa TaxID=77115 RepID=UPI0018E1FCCC|nr:uncharacterized protein LOC119778806 [Cyprinodon tularosa]
MKSASVLGMMWVNIRVCLPFTLMVIALSGAVRLDGAPVTYYMNLLLSNLVQLGAMVALMTKINEYQSNTEFPIVFGCGALASLCFRTIIALERYFLISWPQLHFIRQTKVSVLFCLLIWVFCVVIFPVFIHLGLFLLFCIFPFIPAPVFILCLTLTIKNLRKATSVSAREKKRIIGSLLLLFCVYSLMVLPLIYYLFGFRLKQKISLCFFLLSPFMDLILFLFMYKNLTSCCSVSAAAERESLKERETIKTMFEDYLNVMIWMDIRVCFPFTLLAVGLCFMVYLDQHPVAYYVNLLIANLIQLITLIFIATNNLKDLDDINSTCVIIYGANAMASLYFRVIIALERCFFIIWPKLQFIRQTKTSAIICILVWILCIVLFPLLIFFYQRLIFFVFALIPSPMFIICPLGTFFSLPRATSVSPEGRRRIVGTMFLLIVNYTLTIVPPTIGFISYIPSDRYYEQQVLVTLFLLSPFIDLFLFVFMRKGPIDDFLSCLCCCKMETSAVDDSSLSA